MNLTATSSAKTLYYSAEVLAYCQGRVGGSILQLDDFFLSLRVGLYLPLDVDIDKCPFLLTPTKQSRVVEGKQDEEKGPAGEISIELGCSGEQASVTENSLPHFSLLTPLS